MKMWCSAAAVLIGALLVSSCRRNTADATPISGPPQVGALYSLNDGEGGFRAAKIIAVEDEVVFTCYYSQRWTSRPTPADAQKADKAVPLAFSSETFAGMRPVQLENGSVSADELDAYETWKQSKQEVF